MTSESPTTIEVIKFLDGNTSEDGTTTWINLETQSGPLRLQIPYLPLAALPYILLPLVQEANAKTAGPGEVHTFVIDQLDAIEDSTLPNTLILRFGLAKGMNLVLEIPPELVDALADGIAALKQSGPYSLSSKSAH